MIHIGEVIIIIEINMPMGFHLTEFNKSPLKSERTDLVEPQEGQGIFVKCLIIHTSTL
jgi:hypothetical protein